jgi:hypothetical protein
MSGMRRSLTAVLEQNAAFNVDFETEPYECGWASEARWFVRVLELGGPGVRLSLQPQLSPDGLFWCDAEVRRLRIAAPGLYSSPQTQFGQWLRVRGTFELEQGGAARTAAAKLFIYLTLKE